MPMYDVQCEACQGENEMFAHRPELLEPCRLCGTGKVSIVVKPRTTGGVIGDDIPGGLEIRHGLCHPDGTPRKFYSHTEIRAAAKKAGLVNYVDHVPERGSDKSRHTTRWS